MSETLCHNCYSCTLSNCQRSPAFAPAALIDRGDRRPSCASLLSVTMAGRLDMDERNATFTVADCRSNLIYLHRKCSNPMINVRPTGGVPDAAKSGILGFP